MSTKIPAEYPYTTTTISTRYRNAGGGHSDEDIIVEKGTNLARLVEDLQVPAYLKTSLGAVVEALVEEVEFARPVPVVQDEAQATREIIQRYKTATTAYSDPVSEEPNFAKAYNALVNSADGAIFDALLQLERGYAHAIAEAWSQHEREMSELHERHAMETESIAHYGESSSDFESVMVRQVEEMETLQATWASEIQDMHATQRHEYRDFVFKVHEELQQRKDAGPIVETTSSEAAEPIVTDAKQVVSAAIKKLTRSASREMIKMDTDVNGTPVAGSPPGESQTPVSSAPKVPKADDPQLAKMKAELQEMGFSAELAEAALDITKRDMERSIILLLEEPERVVEHASAMAAAPPPPSSSSTVTSHMVSSPVSTDNQPSLMKRSSSFFQQLKTLSAGPTPPESPTMGRKQFSARSFLQQQQTKLNNSSAPLKRVSSILGKAMAALALDEEDDDGEGLSNEPELSESFTLYFGTQVRTMYNMRLQVSVLEDVFRPPGDAAQDLAVRAQSANALYSQSLSGVILLVSTRDFGKYGGARTPNSVFVNRCKRSTEFHFDDFETQLQRIGSEFPKNESGEVILRDGDFFITRHSNLGLVQVVFHLCIDESNEGELTSRSTLITGYRSILRVAQRWDVHSITLPLLLLPDTVALSPKSSNATEAALMKRAELVLKSTKGLIMEHSRMTKHAGDSSGIERHGRTMVFVLPRGIGGSRTEDVFGVVRERLAEIFRTY
ncbi:hypothetical protein HK097_004608 [Rhizophlyctis rosea]|uniref:UBA domain-containing protein n=1 Tax=Rhizophlyctis rosea TaxID=64517 RepID=A0AAD5X4W9_9FUNG|nr:hypothetical protein HK097_004608 [Rhizophlyctis rosea]